MHLGQQRACAIAVGLGLELVAQREQLTAVEAKHCTDSGIRMRAYIPA